MTEANQDHPKDASATHKVDPTLQPDEVNWLEIEKYLWQHVAGAESLYQQASGPLQRMDALVMGALSSQVVAGYTAVATVRLVRLLEGGEKSPNLPNGTDLSGVLAGLKGAIGGAQPDKG